jgi:type IV pilus assembly protein PilE
MHDFNPPPRGWAPPSFRLRVAAPARFSARRGFTLFEMIIAMVILSVLAAIALPAYRLYVLQSNREVGREALAKIVKEEASYFGDQQHYTDLYNIGYPAANPAAPIYVDPDGSFNQTADVTTVYAIAIVGRTAADAVGTCTLSGALTPGDYVLLASPMNGQSADGTCANLCLARNGDKGASGPGADSCWPR